MSNPKRTVAIINAAKLVSMRIGAGDALDEYGTASYGLRIAVDGAEYEVNVTVTPFETYVIPRDREQWREVA